MNTKILSIVCGVLLIVAIPSGWEYSFYVLLRWIISISAVVVAYKQYYSKQYGWVFIFGSIGFLFNPIVPIYLEKSNWIMIDLVVAIMFFLMAYKKNDAK